MSDGDDATVAGGKRPASRDVAAERSELVANRYQIVRWLGGGGMGRVYEALDTELGERVALKTLNSDLSAAAIERFRREVRLTRKIQHANVARMIDIGEHGGERFLTMELVDGVTLKTELGATMPWSRLSRIAVQICAGLEAAHRMGVIHRDLKPDNVLIERGTDRAVITDFGIARSADEIAMTQIGTVIGTPRYMAPEQLAGNPVDARSDLFALGVMLYELATASRPWTGNDVASIAIAQLRDPPRPFVGGDAPAAFGAIVMRCLALDPANRPTSALEVQQAIEQGVPTEGAVTRTVVQPRASGPITEAEAVTAIAVLPFVCAADDEYLADGIVEDLIDTLASTVGLRVRPAGLMRTRTDPDPREVGRRLEVDHVVVGSLRRIAGTLRVATRLISVADGFQLWSQRKDCSETDVLTVSGEHARGVAMALSTRAAGAAKPIDPRAVELYLRARAEMRRFWGVHNESAMTLLEEAAQYAPTSAPILGALAYATVQAWLMRGNPALVSRVQGALERGLACRHGEAYLGSAVFKLNRNDLVGGAADLGTALLLAPMSASVHEISGKILDELGAITEGRFHLDTAVGLDPGRTPTIEIELARMDAFHDRKDQMIRRLEALIEHTDTAIVRLGLMYHTRLCGYFRDFDRMRATAPRFSPTSGDNVNPTLTFVATCVPLLTIVPAAWDEAMTRFHGGTTPARTRIIGLQILTEMAVAFGEPARAFESLRAASDLGLFDLTWMDRCPLFEDQITREPAWQTIRTQVAERGTRLLAAFRATGG